MSVAVESWPTGGTQLRAHRPRTPLDMGQLWELAERLSGVDGFVPRALLHKPPAILATLLAGAELGLGPMESLRAIHVIEGRVTLSAEVGRALVLAAGHEFKVLENSDTRVEVAGRRTGTEQWTPVEWTRDRANRAKLTSKAVWSAYPRQMLMARASSELCRIIFPDVLAGLELTEDLEVEPEAPAKVTKVRAPRATVPAPPLSAPGVAPEAPTAAVEHRDGPPLDTAPSVAPEPTEAARPRWQTPVDAHAEPAPEPEAGQPTGRFGRRVPPEAPTATAEAPPSVPVPPRPSGPSPAPGRPPLPGESVSPPPADSPPEPVTAEVVNLAGVPLDRAYMLRRLHARMGEVFAGVARDTVDDYRHAMVALVTRRREDGGPVTSSAELTEAEQMGFEARLNDVAAGRASLAHTDHGTVEVRMAGWVYEVGFDPLTIEPRTEGPL